MRNPPVFAASAISRAVHHKVACNMRRSAVKDILPTMTAMGTESDGECACRCWQKADSASRIRSADRDPPAMRAAVGSASPGKPPLFETEKNQPGLGAAMAADLRPPAAAKSLTHHDDDRQFDQRGAFSPSEMLLMCAIHRAQKRVSSMFNPLQLTRSRRTKSEASAMMNLCGAEMAVRNAAVRIRLQ